MSTPDGGIHSSTLTPDALSAVAPLERVHPEQTDALSLVVLLTVSRLAVVISHWRLLIGRFFMYA